MPDLQKDTGNDREADETALKDSVIKYDLDAEERRRIRREFYEIFGDTIACACLFALIYTGTFLVYLI